MPASERVLAVARDWVRKAENDLMNAAHTLKLGADGPTDTVCFHGQQCVEKYLKPLLVSSSKSSGFAIPIWTSQDWRPGAPQPVRHLHESYFGDGESVYRDAA